MWAPLSAHCSLSSLSSLRLSLSLSLSSIAVAIAVAIAVVLAHQCLAAADEL